MAITHSNNKITISGVETGDALRTYISENTSLGTVYSRTIIFTSSIEMESEAEFTDNDATYVFTDAYHFDFPKSKKPKKFELINGIIIYNDKPKGHTTHLRAESLKLHNVQYRIEGDIGRSDFFSNRKCGSDLNNVTFISNGRNNFLHLRTDGGLLEGIKIIVEGGSIGSFQPDAPKEKTLIIRDMVLDPSVGSIAGNGGGNLTAVTRFENLTWNRSVWKIGVRNRGQYYKIINPNKPDDWEKYVGSTNLNKTKCDEFHTYRLKIVDENLAPLNEYKLLLYREDKETIVFNLSTDSLGKIEEQEVLTYAQTGNGEEFTQYDNFKLRGISYKNNIISGTKELAQGKLSETLIASTDIQVTEKDKSTVDAYEKISNNNEFYDKAKSYLVDHYTHEVDTLIKKDGKYINTGEYAVVIDKNASEVFTLSEGTITIKSEVFTGNIRSNKTVTITNDAVLEGNIIDSNADSYLLIEGVQSFSIYNSEEDSLKDNNPIAQVEGDTYKFNFQEVTTFYVRAKIRDIYLNVPIEIKEAGETFYSLETSALLMSLPRMDDIEQVIRDNQTAVVNAAVDFTPVIDKVNDVNTNVITNSSKIDTIESDIENVSNKIDTSKNSIINEVSSKADNDKLEEIKKDVRTVIALTA